MSKKDESPLSEPEFVSISREELEELKQSKSETRQLAEALAAAIQDSRKPYVSPGDLENQAASRASMKRMAEGQRLSKKQEQDACPHIMACNPLSSTRDMFNRASIIKHRLDTGIEVLVCTNCQKVAWPDDPDYLKLYNAHTTNQPSSAGQRPHIRDFQAAMEAGRLR